MNSSRNMKELVEYLHSQGVVRTQLVMDSMLKVDRKDFIGFNTYVDHSQSINYNVVISAPHIHGEMMEYLAPKIKKGCRILDVGSGTGYLTVAFSKMMDDTGVVVGIEHISDLYKLGYQNIMKSHSNLIKDKKIILVQGDGRMGFKELAPFDIIHVGAGAKKIPSELIAQLKNGGRMAMPIGPDGDQYIYIIDKDMNGNLSYQKGCGVCFVPLTSVQQQLLYGKQED